ncbi:MAG: L,D-transpeptidase family protein [Ilumatobacteraceae bacterium]|nr:L,D-transpeptidase family protein [Ilumatobacteraceae bacterium]
MPETPPPRRATTWLPAVAAVALLGGVVFAGVAGGSGGGGDDAAPSVPTDVVAVPPEVPVSVHDAVVTVETTAPITKTILPATIGPGSAGPEVERLQQRLTELGFAPGPIDGYYGDLTTQAVWAFEKLVMQVPRSEATGRVDPDMWDYMQDPIQIVPRRPDSTPNHTEIYLPEQVIVVFHDDRPVFVGHMSSGDGQEWCEEVTISPGEYGNEKGTEPLKRGECGRSITPGGVYQFYRRVEGRRESALGGMLNPVYFNYGIAVHGGYEVPLRPASHGCIRIANAISRQFYDVVDLGDQVYVWDGVKEPEHYGNQPPVFNWRDPDYTTTTTSTTTTTTSTTTTTTLPTTTTTAAPAPATTTTAPVPTTTTSTTTTVPAAPSP